MTGSAGRCFLILYFFVSVMHTANAQQNAPAGGPLPGQSHEINSSRTTASSTPEKSFELLPGEDPHNQLVSPFLGHLAGDQKQFWTSPARLRKKDLRWIVPFGGMTAAFIAGDSWLSKQVPGKPDQLDRSLKISDYSTYALIGAGGGAFLLGHMTHNDHLSETGLLAGEAAINSTAITYLLKTATQRPRPLQDNGNGTFFQGGASLASEHSAIAWSIASVVAHEYPGPLTKLMAYGLATAVTMTRVTAKQHFPSDVIVGSALGWYFGRQVYRAHHDPELGGTAWGNFHDTPAESGPRDPANMSSPDVPPDSWVYPAFERLQALGYIHSAYLGMRPWTRMECARLLEEANETIGNTEDAGQEGGQGQKIYDALAEEFGPETARLNGAANLGVSLDSVYTRVTNISGSPLRDSYHFGQTIINDFGRPYAEGFNAIAGVSTHAVAGPFSFYIRGEYQHAPATSAYPFTAQQAIAAADFTLPVSNARGEINRLDILDGSVALTFRNTQISFGKQSQWMGPGESGSLLLSNNAEPILMLKIESVAPYKIPLMSRFFGPVRSEFFLGQLAGHQFEINGTNLIGPGGISQQPYLHGFKFSFKPTENLEFGMGITAQFAGPGLPFTWGNFVRTFYSHTPGPTATGFNPGKRLSSFDFSYRFPGLRKWLTVYNDALVVDEISPIGSTRPVLNPGIYLPQIPKIRKLELRAEGLHESLTDEFAPGYVYYGLRRYRSGYTNNQLLMGSWIGRAGRGGQGWLTYSFSPRTRLEFGYRQQLVSRDFIGGGRSSDYAARGEFLLGKNLLLSGFLQYEHWWFPVLSSATRSDVAASVQLTFYPKWGIRK
jgi:Capsule assembly protein Wzi/PAP2 superfamily